MSAVLDQCTTGQSWIIELRLQSAHFSDIAGEQYLVGRGLSAWNLLTVTAGHMLYLLLFKPD